MVGTFLTFTLFRACASLDITLNDDDGLPNLMCAKCKRRVESLDNHILAGLQVAEGYEKSLAETHYAPLYYPDKFTMLSPNSDVT